MSSLASTLTRPFKAVLWYLKEVMGENAYVHYLEHYERHHGSREGALSERQFWREHVDEQSKNPQARCC